MALRAPRVGHFASHDARCEGQQTEGRLGFLPTRGSGLVRTYSAGANVHWVSAAPIPPSYGYEATLGYLLEAGGDGRTALYSCRSGAADQFLSLDPGCEGREPLGREGWLYASPPVTEETDPLYRCLRPGIAHFASHDPACEGQKPEGLLGYLRRRQPALHQYGSRATGTNWVTTGAPGAGYRYQRTLGFLVESGGSNLHAIYGCRTVPADHFLSLDAGCEGFTSEGRLGFAFDAPPGAEDTVALYRCIDLGRTHFASLDPNCEGHVTEARLGYVRTVEQGPPPPPACGPSAGVVELSLSGKARRVVRFGRGATLTGRALRPGGVPAAGADVRILENTVPLVEVGRTTAGPDGSFSFALPPGASRTLLAAFRSAPADPALACSPTARLAVRAKARLRAKPRRLRAGRVVRFRGRVKGPLPPAASCSTCRRSTAAAGASSRPRARGRAGASARATASAAGPGRAPTASASGCRARRASPTSAATRTRRRCASGARARGDGAARRTRSRCEFASRWRRSYVANAARRTDAQSRASLRVLGVPGRQSTGQSSPVWSACSTRSVSAGLRPTAWSETDAWRITPSGSITNVARSAEPSAASTP